MKFVYFTIDTIFIGCLSLIDIDSSDSDSPCPVSRGFYGSHKWGSPCPPQKRQEVDLSAQLKGPSEYIVKYIAAK